MVRREEQAESYLKKALELTRFSYAPYSKFKVACIIVASDGRQTRTFYGVNVENASYGLTVCAERVAVFKAVSEGFRKLERIYLVAKDVSGNIVEDILPCGACRQVLSEFSDGNTLIYNYKRCYTLEELLPFSFKLKT